MNITEVDHEGNVQQTTVNMKYSIVESEKEIDQEFFSPMQSPFRKQVKVYNNLNCTTDFLGPSNAEACLKKRLRRSMSTGNLLTIPVVEVQDLTQLKYVHQDIY